MMRLLLIFVLLTQMGCGVFLQTTAGTLVGTLTSEVVRDKLLDKDDDDEALMVGTDSDDNLYILKP